MSQKSSLQPVALEQHEDHQPTLLKDYKILARARNQHRESLYDQLTHLNASFQQERLAYDKKILSPEDFTVQLFMGVVEVGGNLEQIEQENLQARHNYRQKIVAHLLAQREKIEQKFRQEFILDGKTIATSGQIVEAIAEDLTYDILADLTPTSRASIYNQLAASTNLRDESRTGAAIFKLCQVFPHLDDLKVDLYNKADLELFLGHLIATFTGSGKHIWMKYRNQLQDLIQKIDQLSNRAPLFPQMSAFGQLAEPMRIYLLQECLRNQIETPEQASQAKNMLEYYSNFGKSSENHQVLAKFQSQPSNGVIMDRLKSLFGHPTRRAILDKLRRTLPGQIPLGEIYQVVQNINQLNSAKSPSAEHQDNADLATIILLDLEDALRLYNQESQIEEGFPEHSGQALRLLVQKVRELQEISSQAI